MKESRTGNIDLLEDNPLAVEAMYQYFYKFDYSNLAKDDPEALLLHVRVYCLAHKYEIDALKALAAKLFLRTAGDDFSVATFPAIIKEIYENTDTSDTTLRKVAVEVAIENHDALFEDGAEEFSAMMTDIGEFGRDVFKAMAASRMIVKKAKKGVEVYYCRIDNVHWKVDLNTASPTFRITKTCPGCQATALSPSSSPNHSFNIYTCTQCRVSCGSTRHWVTSVSLLCPYCNTKATHLEA